MHLLDLFEARSYPDLNPKVSVNQYIAQAMASAEKLPGTDITNVFVSFTQLPKLGINPRSKYNTPLGIYSYPAEYIAAMTKGTDAMSKLPFAGKKPYANIFQGRGNIIEIGKVSLEEEREYYKKLSTYVDRLPTVDFSKTYAPPGQNWIMILNNTINDSRDFARERMRPGGRLWYVTYRMSGYINQYLKRPASLVWNEMFRRGLGIDGCVDMGSMIIHENEPYQAVFFSLAATNLLGTVANKYSPEQISVGKERGEKLQQQLAKLREALNKKDYDEVYQLLMQSTIDGDFYDSNYLFKYIPKDIRYRFYTDYKSDLVFSIGKNIDTSELLFALSTDPILIGNNKMSQYEKIVFDNLDAIFDMIKNYKGYYDAEHFARRFFTRFPRKNTEYLKRLVDLYPGIYEHFYNEWGAEEPGMKEVYQYALKQMYKHPESFDRDDIDNLKNTIDFAK